MSTKHDSRSAWIVEALRSPIGKAHAEHGWYRDVHPNTMLGYVYHGLIEQSGISPRLIDDILVGCTSQFGEQSRNIARNAWLQAGYPFSVPASVIDRRCGSGQSAVNFAFSTVATGFHDIAIAGGVEHMNHIPMDAAAVIEEQYGAAWPAELKEMHDFPSMGEAAERIASKWALSRADMDEFAVRSHRRAAAASERGQFAREIIPVVLADVKRDSDQSVRADASAASLSSLKPAFRADGSVTAGNSSPLSDGAAGVLIASEEAVRKHGLERRAKIVDATSVGVDPRWMLTGPVPATRLLLERNGMGISDIDLIEIHEAFSAVALMWIHELEPDMERVNVNGGALAMGHPTGASGARLFATLLAEMEQRDVEFGLITMCCGGGLGVATLIQRV